MSAWVASRRTRTLAGVGACGIVLALAYLAVAAWAGTRSARGTTVAGVDVGGLDRTSVRQRLDRDLAPRADRPLRVTAGEGSTTLVPGEAGLRVDTSATAARLVGFSLRPSHLWQHLVGAGAAEPVTAVDRPALRRAVDAAAQRLDADGAEGAITFTTEGATLREPVEGRTVDRAGAVDTLARRWALDDPVVLPAALHEPGIPASDLRAAFEGFARPATSGPLHVVVGTRRVDVPVANLALTLAVAPDDSGALVGSVDGARLAAVLTTLDPALKREPRDATIDVVDGKTVTTPSRAGLRIDPQALADAVLPALTDPARTATLTATQVEPKVTTKALADLDIVEQVSSFTTQFPHNPPRTTNLRIAARVLDGMIVKPGQTFSLNAALGERTPEKGYQKAPVIYGGRLTQDYGGGVSQVSTTLFNAVFFAGLDTVRHQPHSFYISRYPEGREATLSWPNVDQTFRNDSGHGILIKTHVSTSAITVSFYGTKIWDVTATKGPRTDIKQPATIHDTDGVCVPQSPNTGFTVRVTRIFARDGKQVKTERFTTRYRPQDRVICG